MRLKNGKIMNVHPSFSFKNSQWHLLPIEAQRRIRTERAAYKRQKAERTLASLSSQHTDCFGNPYPSYTGMTGSVATSTQYVPQYNNLPSVVHVQGTSAHGVPLPPPPSGASVPPLPPSNNDNISTVSQATSMMGGRNDQASRSGRHFQGYNIKAVKSKRRNISSITSQDYKSFQPSPSNTKGWNETDSNADTCCLGKKFIVIQYTERTADVYPYNSSYQPLHNVPIVSGATAWDNPIDGSTKILVVNEGLFYGSKLDHSLLNPNQLRKHGLIYQDNPFNKDEQLGITSYDGITIPLEMKGTKIRFNSRVPTQSELENIPQSRWIHLTSTEPWNPATLQLSSYKAMPIRRPP